MVKYRARAVVTILTTLLTWTAFPALGDQGRTPIPSVPWLINRALNDPNPLASDKKPGAYILTKNLVNGPNANPAISINSPALNAAVDIDLNGFVLDNSNNAAPVIQIIVFDANAVDVRIHDGAIRGGTIGIQASGPVRKLVVENVQISGQSQQGIDSLTVLNTVIRNCEIFDTGGEGIFVGVPTDVSQATIENNVIRNTVSGIVVDDPGSTFRFTVAIRNNRVEAIVSGSIYNSGIYLGGCQASLVEANTIRGVAANVPGTGTGIRLVGSPGNQLFENVVNTCTLNGVSLESTSNDNLIWKNVVRNVSNYGISVATKQNQIEGNVINTCGRGLVLTAASQANVYRGNTARGSTGIVGCAGACGATFDFCNAGAGNTSMTDNFMPAAPCN